MSKVPPAFPTRQAGTILLLALVFASLAIIALFPVRALASRLEGEQRTQRALEQARQALIARAATDDNRPGSLPCPDLATDSGGLANFPGDGKADLLTRNQCPTQIGWLPWATLNIDRPRDRHHETLWYVLAPALRDDDSAQPINSDTAPGLWLEEREVAALIIAPGPPLDGQQRPATRSVDYLEGHLASTSPERYLAGSGNDRLVHIDRQTLMAAVGQRVAQQTRQCLQAHARANNRFPWPAPFGSDSDQGRADTLFGRIPDSQPSPGAPVEITDASDALATARLALPAAVDGPAQLAALDQVDAQLVRSRNLLTNLEQLAGQIATHGNSLGSSLQRLTDTLLAATANGRIARSEGSTINRQVHDALWAIDTLADALQASGLDALAWQARQQGTTMPAEDARQALLNGRTRLHSAGESFRVRDEGEPRPVQQALVPYAQAIGEATPALQALSQIIAEHALRVRELALQGRALAVDSEALLRNSGQARDTLSSWIARPTGSNRQKADTALARLDASLDLLAAALSNQASATTGGAATAWPLAWATRDCDFLVTKPAGWWQQNQWSSSVFYQIAHPDPRHPGHLQVGRERGLALVVIAAGPALPGQQRPGNRLSDYLEGDNAAPGRAAPAVAPAPHFESAERRIDFNDQVAF